MTLPEGLYDLLLTQGAAASLDPQAADVQPPGSNSADYAVDALARQLSHILADLRGDDADKARRELEIVNGLLVALRHRLEADANTQGSTEIVDLLAEPMRVLKAIRSDRQYPVPPEAGLAHPWLFTAGKGSPALLQEIRRELASADQVDVLVSFITVSGVRKLRDILQQATAVSADGAPALCLRVLTTTYTGATEARALDELARLPGCEVRVSLDGRRTRLHAKAWIFHRRTGFGSAYVGSANLSGAALTGGLEWTVKLAQRSQEGIFARAVAHFETLWEDNEFERYDPENPAHRQALLVALWRALELQLLAPFEYYGCDDPTDFSEVPWDQAGERSAIDNLVTGNDVRARLVVNEWRRLAADPAESRALVFCVSVAHAEFMADQLNRAGLPAMCVVGTTPEDERRRAPERLRRGELCALVTVDLYNEGVDLPSVDTLLLLRPTQSPVLFQQQIGRGLRLAPDKDSCLVLDFVGQHRADFRFDRLLSGLTGLSRRELTDAVDKGFGSLPPGCHIQLQRQTRDQVLRGLRELTMQNWRRLRSELQAYAALRGRASIRLAEFLREQALELDEVYRTSGRSGWTALRRDAGLIVSEPGPEEDYFSGRFGDLIHVDDPTRLDMMRRIGSTGGALGELSAEAALTVQMLAYQVDGRHDRVGDHAAFLRRLADNSSICEELADLADVLQSRVSLPAHPIPGLEDTPLCLHAAYGAREILTAVGWLNAQRRAPFQAGVLPLMARNIELLFVTLDKSAGYHDRIAYHDYAISAERFHWQTQNSAGPDTRSGRRYLESSGNGWRFQLFVRERQGSPYRACGGVVLERAEGDRPMSIVWRLETPLPGRLFREFSVLRGA